MNDLDKVKAYLEELNLSPTREVVEEELVVVDDESRGIKSLIIDCQAPIVVLEQYILPLQEPTDAKVLLRLLQINRTLVHGAFVVDESGTRLLFRDTLQLENLDLNELEGSINSLSLALAEHASELIKFAKA